MKRKYRLERCGLSGVKEVTDRLTALGGQGWRVVSTAHHGAELFVLMELEIDTSHQEENKKELEPKKGPGRPKKQEVTTATTSAGTIEVTIN